MQYTNALEIIADWRFTQERQLQRVENWSIWGRLQLWCGAFHLGAVYAHATQSNAVEMCLETVYHVTDLPAFVSGSQLVFFDPQVRHAAIIMSVAHEMLIVFIDL